MTALVAWTFAVLALIPVARFRAAAQLPNRDFMNLLELPLLFYVGCIALYVTLSVDAIALALAWLYFALRVAHSLVHLTYNNVFHRLAAYAASSIVLAGLWLRFGVALVLRPG